MDDYENAICKRMKTVLAEAESDINLIDTAQCVYTRNMLLYQLRSKLNEIVFLSGMICRQVDQMPVKSMELQQQNQRNLTRKELVKFNGKDGNSAYVAVNGIVYDVTNSAVWAAATHFGLMAGNDLTSEFASCHADQFILSKLKVVGKLI